MTRSTERPNVPGNPKKTTAKEPSQSGGRGTKLGYFGIAAGLAAVAVVLYLLRGGNVEPVRGGGPIVAVTVPELSATEQGGEAAYNARCASCHGEDAAGREGAAPPLVHPIYEPGHHGDQAFLIAAQLGVRSHHWSFGDMPPVEGVTDQELAAIVTYVRALQRANGID